MGQSNQGQKAAGGEYVIVREVANGSIVRESSSGRLHFVKEYSFTNQQAYQQAFVNFSKKLPEKHEHILHLERTNTQLQNTFCSTFYKISLLYQYLDHTLDREIKQRIQEKKVFDEKQVWSVLCSCALAVSEMIRFEGRSHAALRTQDLRLTQEGVVKILSLEMVGMDPEQDSSQEGTAKQLALTILNCILMDEISNQSEDFLLELIDALDSSPEMKNILRIMLNPATRFVDLEEYLFKLVQEDAQSLNSYSHTPIIKEKAKNNSNSYSRIPEESKEDDSLVNLQRDAEDNPENAVSQPYTQEEQIPDENDIIEDSKSKTESHRATLRDNQTPSPQKNQLSMSNKQQFKYSNNANENSLFTDPKLLNLITSNLQEINKRKSIANSRKMMGYSESSSKLERSQSKALNGGSNYNIGSSSLNMGGSNSHIGIAQTNTRSSNNKGNTINPTQSSTINISSNLYLGGNSKNYMQTSEEANKSNLLNPHLSNTVNTMTTSAVKDSNQTYSNSNVKTNTKQNQYSRGSYREEKNSYNIQIKSVANIQSVKNEEISIKSEKTLAISKSNPQDKKIGTSQKRNQNPIEKRYENIMEMEDMGFKKNKNSKVKEEMKQSREEVKILSHPNPNPAFQPNPNPSCSNVNTVIYNSNSSVYSTLPLSNNYTDQQISISDNRGGAIQYSFNQPRQEYEYVTETYQKGKYEGTKLNNMRHGKGAFYYNEGGKYIGEWKENKMDGRGVLYYPNNAIAYDGEWRADQLEGRGTLYNEEVAHLTSPFDFKDWQDVDEYWVKYEGQFREDSKNGQGKLYLSNGEIFEGNFREDMVWGQGIMLRKDGSRIRGLWRENKLIKLN